MPLRAVPRQDGDICRQLEAATSRIYMCVVCVYLDLHRLHLLWCGIFNVVDVLLVAFLIGPHRKLESHLDRVSKQDSHVFKCFTFGLHGYLSMFNVFGTAEKLTSGRKKYTCPC